MLEFMTKIFGELGQVEVIDTGRRLALVLTGSDLSRFYAALERAEEFNERGFNIIVM